MERKGDQEKRLRRRRRDIVGRNTSTGRIPGIASISDTDMTVRIEAIESRSRGRK